MGPDEISFKEQRIREITLAYYSIPEIKKALFKFSSNRECVPRYYEGFGKRPDTFQYESDILEHVKKGATSFHCSEELWGDPLEISTELSPEEFNELRIGWDLLLDVDSPYLEYSKIYADLLIKILEFHGLRNFNVKFSGSKGFHLIVPWKAFPEEIYGSKTKDIFPEWPRIICQYLGESIQPKLAERILEDENLKDLVKKTGKKEEELLITKCIQCNRPANKKYLITWQCPFCKNEIVNFEGTYNNRKKPLCPECRKKLVEVSRKEMNFCSFCNKDSNKYPQNFEKEKFATERLIDADLVLVAPRHLFRMPYSLHEKTALSSIVLNKHKINDFQLTDAKPFKAKVIDFYPDAEKGEAKELILTALEWKEQKDKEKTTISNQIPKQEPQKQSNQKGPMKEIKIQNPTPDIYPPCIASLISGSKQDGRKRGLFILINFFRSLGLTEEQLYEKISEWNKKNYSPLKEGYIRSQLIWYRRQKVMLPPNCDKLYYKDLAICKPDDLCRLIKNPVSYAIKKYFKSGGR
jgi:hypothetical protein